MMDIHEMSWSKFDPLVQEARDLPSCKGVYLFTIRDISSFSYEGELVIHYYEGLSIIYIGKAMKSLRSRDYTSHFKGHARRSTLRKSLGVLLGLRKLQKDSNIGTTKYKFIPEDEEFLSEWMKKNLMMHFVPLNDDIKRVEMDLIHEYSPLLNDEGNKDTPNQAFRKYLKDRRCDI